MLYPGGTEIEWDTSQSSPRHFNLLGKDINVIRHRSFIVRYEGCWSKAKC